MEYARRIHALLEYNPCAEGSRGTPYITYVDRDQDHSAPFMYETPAYNIPASGRHRARRGWIMVTDSLLKLPIV